MLDEHKTAVNDRLVDMDKDLQNECNTFVVKNGKPQADDNCNDDVVMADAICLQMAKEPRIVWQTTTSVVTVNYDDQLY